MTKPEMINALKEQANLTSNRQAEAAYDAIFSIITRQLKNGEPVSISGFGSFKIVERAARKGRNPHTGEEIQIAASRAVKFTPSKNLKASM
jgi:DNA-binding protein HU-beta